MRIRGFGNAWWMRSVKRCGLYSVQRVSRLTDAIAQPRMYSDTAAVVEHEACASRLVCVMTRCFLKRFRTAFRTVLTVLLVLQRASSVEACLTPVFRYALERWEPDRYLVEVVYRGTLSDEAGKAVDLLADYANRAKCPANLTIQRVDLAKASEGSVEINGLEGLGSGQGRIIVYNPRDREKLRPVWRAPLTAESVEQLVDSPLRREIASRLMRGDSAVWILLESGDKEKDDAAAAVLEEQLAALEKALKLPSDYLHAASPSDVSSLRISFSSVRLKRDDPLEEFLVASLMPPDANEPVAFPVFGRGRALCALVGEHINENSIFSAGSFLVEACTCQVKWMNPGIDLLFAAEWEKIWKVAEPAQEVPELAGVGSLLQAQEAAASDDSSESGTMLARMGLNVSVFIALGSALAVAAVGTVGVGLARAKKRGSWKTSGTSR